MLNLDTVWKMSAPYKIHSYVKDVYSPPKPAVRPSGPLEPGDILLKMNDKSLLNIGISLVEAATLTGDHAAFSHAGLASSGTMIAEMSKEGLNNHNLSGENAGYTYDVFRCQFRQIALAAVEANNALMRAGKVNYTILGAGLSALPSLISSSNENRLQRAIRNIKAHRFDLFCSEHVVFCYVAALEDNNTLTSVSHQSKNLTMHDFFDREPGHYSPSYLYGTLINHKFFQYVGRCRGAKWIAS
ncbi:hypothetical protein EJV46_08260 [Roseococcus sp. SYP-B2431]|uniref:hypothetical protein n=1 Tax=Roseococcus sp. SYP-B2431 TaxID=2496640 RepID=UPI00103FEBC8|nr:hypothetical protein [Roseococcus sp. SYP-B2431]TCH98566.1 hypothetical protein EJV46_08260 [Roseococcus sp. SYP-B2431]